MDWNAEEQFFGEEVAGWLLREWSQYSAENWHRVPVWPHQTHKKPNKNARRNPVLLDRRRINHEGSDIADQGGGSGVSVDWGGFRVCFCRHFLENWARLPQNHYSGDHLDIDPHFWLHFRRVPPPKPHKIQPSWWRPSEAVRGSLDHKSDARVGEWYQVPLLWSRHRNRELIWHRQGVLLLVEYSDS